MLRPRWDNVARLSFATAIVSMITLAIAGRGSAMPVPKGSDGPANSNTATARGPTGPFAVVLGNSDPGTDIVMLADLTGRVVARAQATRPHEFGDCNAAAIGLPLVSTSASRVYYLAGDGQVRSLAPNGMTEAITRLPSGPRVHATFAVSPDDRRIAVAVLNYGERKSCSEQPQIRRRLYVEDLRGGHRVEFSTASSLFDWPIGWHNGALVLAVGPPYVQNMPNPYGATSGFQVVNAATGRRLATVCSNAPATGPLGLAVPAGIVCPRSKDLYAQDWSGQARLFYHAPSGSMAVLYSAALAPDGSRMAVGFCGSATGATLLSSHAEGGGCPQPGVLLVDARGQRTIIPFPGVASGGTLAPLGWLSATQLVLQGTLSSRPTIQMHILDLRSRVLTPLAGRMASQFVAVLPGGLNSPTS